MASQAKKEPETLESRVFKQLRKDLSESKALTPLHWLLIRRACFYYSLASSGGDVVNDKILSDLLVEPLRALRSHDQFLSKIEDEISKAIELALPDPESRRAVITLLEKRDSK